MKMKISEFHIFPGENIISKFSFFIDFFIRCFSKNIGLEIYFPDFLEEVISKKTCIFHV